jgi:hypothetical protein
MFARAGSKSSNVSGSQLWQHHNKDIEVWSAEVVEQKADYIHYNPVEAGFVSVRRIDYEFVYLFHL